MKMKKVVMKPVVRLRDKRFIPKWRYLAYVQFILTLSVLVFAFGPWHYPISNPVYLYAYLFVGQLFFAVGYKQYKWKKVKPWNSIVPINVLVLVGSVLSIAYTLSYMHSRPYLPSIAESLSDLGTAYKIRLDASSYGDIGIIDWIRTGLSPLIFLFLPVVITFWSNFKPYIRAIAITAAVLDSSCWIIAGTNRGIAYIIIIVASCFLLRASIYRLNPYFYLRRHKRLTTLFIALLLFSGFFSFFTSTYLGRLGPGMRYYDRFTGASLDPSNLTIKYLPETLAIGTSAITGYWVHGYKGLSLCMEQEFTFAYGLGHSAVLRDFLRYFRVDPNQIYDLTYEARTQIATGYPAGLKWHTIYPALASDLTFVGALFVLGCLGMLFSIITKEAIVDRNPFAVSLYSILWILIIFVPANNQIANDKRLYLSFIGIFIMWLLSRRNKWKVSVDNSNQ